MIFDLITKQITPSENRIGLSNLPEAPRPTGSASEMAVSDGVANNSNLVPIGEPPSLDQIITEVYSNGSEGSGISAERERDALKAHGSESRFSLGRLQPRHREIMRRVIEGASYADIAAAMGMAASSIKVICNTSIFREELAKLERERDVGIIQRAEDLSNEALDKIKVLMRSARSEVLQASMAKEVLGIAGYSKIEKKQVAVVSGEDVIRELNRRRRETAYPSGGIAGSPDRDGSIAEAEITG